jgi:hypothetical protein
MVHRMFSEVSRVLAVKGAFLLVSPRKKIKLLDSYPVSTTDLLKRWGTLIKVLLLPIVVNNTEPITSKWRSTTQSMAVRTISCT